MKRIFYLLPLLILLSALWGVDASAQIAGCDNDPSCVGNMLTIEETSGRTAQYVDVDIRNPIQRLNTAITFEAWLKPGEQPGKKIFVAGLWGPNDDNNDQWVVFIEGTRITFELNSTGARQGRTDNTIVTVDVPDLYTRGWFHLAAIWDGGTTAARIFIDGIKLAENTNATYPLQLLRTIERQTLQTQIGSCNALYDDQDRNRTFLGNMDEIKIWNRALTDQEVRCQYTRSLQGDESGLILYYRCNDNRFTQNLCDATGNAHWGRLRSGARLDTNLRTIPTSFTVTPAGPLNVALVCTSDTTFSFRLLDTSFCGSDILLEMIGRDSLLFQLSAASMQLTRNNPRTVTARLRASITGDIQASLRIRSADRCGANATVPINIQRRTELSYSKSRVEFDTLYVGCIERTFVEDTIEICNTTGRTMNISGASVGRPASFSWRPANGAQGLPQSLAPGECWRVVVRSSVSDSTRTLYDTLRIASDDRCPGSGYVPLVGPSQDVIVLLDESGGARIDGGTVFNFGSVCPGQISAVQLYQFRNLASDTAYIENIYFNTTEFFTRRQIFPFAAPPPDFAFRPDFIRFRPSSAGTKWDTLHVVASYRGCTIVKKLIVRGYGFNVDNGFDQPNISFGPVTIGKTAQQTVNAFNYGDPSRFTAYLKVGDVFRISSATSFQLNTNETTPVTVEFRPREAITYYDTLCIFDQQCLGTSCIPISGTGVFDALAFDPPYILMENVIGCQCRTATIDVRNASGGTLNILRAELNSGGTGKFTTPTALRIGSISPGEVFRYEVRYCPDDIVNDRADIDYIDIELSDGQSYQILVRGTSVVPKLYIEPLTAFGTVEAGWQSSQRILVENISAVPVDIPATINVPPGYTITGTTPPLPTTLGPRAQLWVDVEFRPMAEQAYDGTIDIDIVSPCPIRFSGNIEGQGKIVRLDVPVTFINFGLNKSCECTDREIPLPNNSEFIPMQIDSVWIDAGGLPNALPLSFTWRSRQTGGATLPYSIPPKSSDTLLITFCPSGISDTSNIVNNARIHIAASAPAWSEEFATTLSGRREINFLPNNINRGFLATRVDVQAPDTAVFISVPDQFLNPSGDSLIITNVTFLPDDRVFTAWANNGAPLPWTIRRGENFRIDIGFRPRAPKTYTAKLVLHTAYPCPGTDTTITVAGTGFAPAFGMQFAFDTANLGGDTFRLSICDTLTLPIMIDRDMPQNLIDILFHLNYDTASLSFYDITSPYTTTASVVDTGDGIYADVKDARDVKAGEVAYVRFLVRGSPNAFPITLDQIDFDSDSLVLFKIIAGGDQAWVIVDEPMIAMSGLTSFDTVNVKTCADREVVVWNPGILPVRFDSLGLPKDHRITASSVPIPVVLNPGDTLRLTVSYCPREEAFYDTTLVVFGTAPCVVTDTGRIYSIGYAPPWPIRLVIAEDPVMGMIADTISVTIRSDQYMPVAPIDLDFSLAYNRRALKFVDIVSPYTTGASGTETNLGLDITIPGIDSLGAGDLARLRFVFAVPDTVVTAMTLDSNSIGFRSDSIFFVKPVPNGDTSAVQVDPRCNITFLNFSGGLGNKLSPPTPNPARGTVTIDVEFFEHAPAKLTLFDAGGREVMTLLDGNGILPGGRYRLEFDVSRLPSGEYFYVFQANRFRGTERLRVVR